MSIIEQLVRFIAPHTCLSCRAEDDRLLCGPCTAALPRARLICYRCQEAPARTGVCDDCRQDAPLTAVYAYAPYRQSVKLMVRSLKYGRARAAASEMGRLMARLLQDLPDDAVLVHIPTATSRIHSRGYDHAGLIARACAQASGTPLRRLLTRHGQQRQVGASRTIRRSQLSAAFRVPRAAAVRGRHIVLVDDVLTTGATLEAAARTLLQAGAIRVDAVVFARA